MSEKYPAKLPSVNAPPSLISSHRVQAKEADGCAERLSLDDAVGSRQSCALPLVASHPATLRRSPRSLLSTQLATRWRWSPPVASSSWGVSPPNRPTGHTVSLRSLATVKLSPL